MYISKGNKKLKGDDNNQFMVWSIPAGATCPYSTALCRKYCYAKIPERIYPNVHKCRALNWADSQAVDFTARMTETIVDKLKTSKRVWFRIHESGDFYSQEYFAKWVQIAKTFPQIKFMAYTKSLDFIAERPYNLVVRFSIWDDTNPADIEKAQAMGLPTYRAVPKEDIDKYPNAYHCVNDCQKCKACYGNNIKEIVNIIH